MPGEDVDRPALTRDMEADFGRGEPANAGQQIKHLFDDARVIAIEQSIQVLAAPENTHMETRTEVQQDPLELPDCEPIRKASLDPRDLRPGQAAPPAQLDLCPAALPSKRTNLESNPDRVHRRRVAGAAYRGVIRALG